MRDRHDQSNAATIFSRSCVQARSKRDREHRQSREPGDTHQRRQYGGQSLGAPPEGHFIFDQPVLDFPAGSWVAETVARFRRALTGGSILVQANGPTFSASRDAQANEHRATTRNIVLNVTWWLKRRHLLPLPVRPFRHEPMSRADPFDESPARPTADARPRPTRQHAPRGRFG